MSHGQEEAGELELLEEMKDLVSKMNEVFIFINIVIKSILGPSCLFFFFLIFDVKKFVLHVNISINYIFSRN